MLLSHQQSGTVMAIKYNKKKQLSLYKLEKCHLYI